MDELDFTIEFNSNLNDQAEADLFDEADRSLRKLTRGHSDITGAAINIRQPAYGEKGYLFEATVVVYARPEQISATKKDEDPMIALKNALSAAERQVRNRREKLSKRWERPGNDPVSQEVLQAEAGNVPIPGLEQPEEYEPDESS